MKNKYKTLRYEISDYDYSLLGLCAFDESYREGDKQTYKQALDCIYR